MSLKFFLLEILRKEHGMRGYLNFSKIHIGKICGPFCSNGAGLLAILMLLKRYRGYENIFIQSNTMYGVKTIAITSGLKYLGAADCSMRV